MGQLSDTGIAKESSKQHMRGNFANRGIFNQRGFQRRKTPQYVTNGRIIAYQDQNQTGDYFQYSDRNCNYHNKIWQKLQRSEQKKFTGQQQIYKKKIS